MEGSDLVQIVTTVDSRSRAEEMVREIVEARLAACGQIVGPVKSTFWWEGKVDSAEEWLIIFKTLKRKALRAAEEIKRLHPYQVPEIIITGTEWVYEGYLKWAAGVVED